MNISEWSAAASSSPSRHAARHHGVVAGKPIVHAVAGIIESPVTVTVHVRVHGGSVVAAPSTAVATPAPAAAARVAAEAGVITPTLMDLLRDGFFDVDGPVAELLLELALGRRVVAGIGVFEGDEAKSFADGFTRRTFLIFVYRQLHRF